MIPLREEKKCRRKERLCQGDNKKTNIREEHKKLGCFGKPQYTILNAVESVF